MSGPSSSQCTAASASTTTPSPEGPSIGPSLGPFFSFESDAVLEPRSTVTATTPAAVAAPMDSANPPSAVGPSIGPFFSFESDAVIEPQSTVAAAPAVVATPMDSANPPSTVGPDIGPSLGPFLSFASDAVAPPRSTVAETQPPAEAVDAPMDSANPPSAMVPSIGPFFSFASDAVLQPQPTVAETEPPEEAVAAPMDSANTPSPVGPSIGPSLGPFLSFASDAVAAPQSTGDATAPPAEVVAAPMDLANLIAAAPSAKFKEAQSAEAADRAEDSDDSMGVEEDEEDASPHSSRPAKKRKRDHKEGSKAKKKKTSNNTGGRKKVEVPAASPHYLAQTFGNKATEVDEGQKTVYVGGLDWSVTEADLEDLFNTIVEFQVVRVVRDFQGRSKGFAYADFSTNGGVQTVVKKYNQTQLHGCTITVLPSKPTKRLYDEKTAFVLNLPEDADAFFAPLKVVAVRRAGGNKAYVDFENTENVLKAIEKSGTEVDGVAVTVSRSIPMKDHKWQVARARKDVSLPARADQQKILQQHEDVSHEAAKHGKVLHIKNLAFSCTEEQVRDFFSQSGEVEEVVVVKNASGKSRGFGFVEMKDEGAAFSAMTLSGQELAGKSVVVSRSYRALTHKKQKDENKSAAPEKGEGNEKGEKDEDHEKGEKGEGGEKGEKCESDEKGEKGEKGESDMKGKKGEGDMKGEKGKGGNKGEKGEGNEKGKGGKKGEKGEGNEKGEKGKGGKKGEKGKGKGDKKGKGKGGNKRHQGEDNFLPYAVPHDGPKPRARMGIGYKPPKVTKEDAPVAEGHENGEKEEKKKEAKQQAKDEDVPKGGLTNEDFRKFLLS